MAFDPESPKDLARLRSAMTRSRTQLQPFREKRLAAVRQFVGFNYSDDGAADRVPINLLELLITTYARQLVPNDPQAGVTTRNRQLKPMAKTFELRVNDELKHMDFGESLRRVVIDSLFSVGIMKVGIAVGDPVEIDGEQVYAQTVYADPVDLDDWVHDMSARTFSEARFCGNRYRMPLEEIRDNPMFDSKVRKLVAPSTEQTVNETGDPRIYQVSRSTYGAGGEDADIQQQGELWDVWCPEANAVVTIWSDGYHPLLGEDMKPLRVVEWTGPDCGPYHMLAMMDVPGQVMPLSPVANTLDLHELANQLYRKVARQAERQKTILAYRSGTEKDADRVRNAEDGEAVKMDSPDKAKELRFGGVDNNNFAFLLQLREQFSYFAGNLDAIAGLGPQADTLGQDRLIAASASKRLSEMGDRTIRFTRKVLRSIGYWLWSDPVGEKTLVKRVKGTDIEIPVEWKPGLRRGNYLDYEIEVAPYSFVEASPQAKANFLIQYLQQVALPLAGQMEQQGVGINLQALNETISQYYNLPELLDILTPIAPREEGGGRYDGPRQSPVTSRNYTRTNAPKAERTGNQDMIQKLMTRGASNGAA